MQRDKSIYTTSLRKAVRPKKKKRVRDWDDDEPQKIERIKKKSKLHTSDEFISKINEYASSHGNIVLLDVTSSIAVIAKETTKNVITKIDSSIFQPYERNNVVNLCTVTILEWVTNTPYEGGEIAPRLEVIGCPVITVANPNDIDQVIEEI
jgi:hypothetical protein